jgi:hypothetical protein
MLYENLVEDDNWQLRLMELAPERLYGLDPVELSFIIISNFFSEAIGFNSLPVMLRGAEHAAIYMLASSQAYGIQIPMVRYRIAIQIASFSGSWIRSPGSRQNVRND